MITKLRHWWHETRSTFWFVPAVIVLGAVGLAAVLIGVDVTVDLDVVERWPLLFGAGAAGARGLLTAVASSMITVAGVVFSITIVEDADDDLAVSLAEQAWVAVPARKTGYIQSIDGDSLLAFASERGNIVRMECGIGEFVVEGTPLISVADPARLDEDTDRRPDGEPPTKASTAATSGTDYRRGRAHGHRAA